VDEDPEFGSAPSLGAQIRAVRAGRGLSISELARRSGMSQSFLSQVEAGKTDISVGRFVRLAQALDVDVTELLGEGARAGESVVREEDQAELPTPSAGLLLRLLAPSIDHARTNAVGTLEPGAVAEPAERNIGSESLVYMLEGTARIELTGGRRIVLQRGDSASYRSDEFERMANDGRRRNRFVWIQAAPRA
jgi:transcriptional regulator with XRE-family HTH domain